MRYVLLISLLIIVGYQKTSPIQGTYYSNYSKPGTDKPYQFLQIHHANNNNLSFYMEVGRGAPDYNSGALYGTLTLNKRSGNYEYLPKDTIDDCKLVFIKHRNTVIVHTVNGQCGFGYGVFADGTYILKTEANPQYSLVEQVKEFTLIKLPQRTLVNNTIHIPSPIPNKQSPQKYYFL